MNKLAKTKIVLKIQIAICVVLGILLGFQSNWDAVFGWSTAVVVLLELHSKEEKDGKN